MQDADMTSTIRITAKASLSADLFDTDLDAVAEALNLKCVDSVPKPRPVSAAQA